MKNRKTFYPAVIILSCILLAACSSSQTYSFNIGSRLADGGKINLDVDVDFKDEKGCRELEKKLNGVRYAFTLVYSRKKYEDVEHQGETRTIVTLKQILKIKLREEVTAIRTRNYTIQPGT